MGVILPDGYWGRGMEWKKCPGCAERCPGCAERDARIAELEAVADAAREFMLSRMQRGSKCKKLCAALNAAGR